MRIDASHHEHQISKVTLKRNSLFEIISFQSILLRKYEGGQTQYAKYLFIQGVNQNLEN